jgi:hypothetical protein
MKDLTQQIINAMMYRNQLQINCVRIDNWSDDEGKTILDSINADIQQLETIVAMKVCDHFMQNPSDTLDAFKRNDGITHYDKDER